MCENSGKVGRFPAGGYRLFWAYFDEPSSKRL